MKLAGSFCGANANILRSSALALCHWSFAHPVAPVVTVTSVILSSNNMQNEDILVPAYQSCPEKGLLDNCHVIIPGFLQDHGLSQEFSGSVQIHQPDYITIFLIDRSDYMVTSCKQTLCHQTNSDKALREIFTFHGLAHLKLTWGLPTLSLTIKSSIRCF